MATSPNFNWPEPDNTDLVKNGALAIRTAVNAIDTSLVDLKGGTTGQVLAKASNTDMDFIWAADAGAPTSLGYAAGKNEIINGAFTINQRAFTSTTSSGTYGHDRWLFNYSTGTVTYSNQAFTAGAAPVSGYEGTQFAQIATSGQSATSANTLFDQRIEDVRTNAGQTVTLSFWARATSGTPSVAVEVGQNFGSGGSPSADVTTYAGKTAITTSWARYTITVAVPSISGKTIGTNANSSFFYVRFWLSAGSDFNARSGTLGIQNSTIGIWGVQLEAGSTATAFQTATGTIQGELAACQRYYYRFGGSGAYQSFGLGYAKATTLVQFPVPNPVTMRANPSSIEYSTLICFDGAGFTGAVSALVFDGAFNNISRLQATVTGATTNRPYELLSNNSTSGYVGINAEL